VRVGAGRGGEEEGSRRALAKQRRGSSWGVGPQLGRGAGGGGGGGVGGSLEREEGPEHGHEQLAEK
jgi:hypothetical protein